MHTLPDGVMPLSDAHSDFLRDESRLIGHAEGIAFPQDEDALAAILARAYAAGIPVTIQGGRTGIAGGAVPFGGIVVNLSRMDRIGPVVRAGAGSGSGADCRPAVTREGAGSDAGGGGFPPSATMCVGPGADTGGGDFPPSATMCVGPGAVLSRLRAEIARGAPDLFFPPDPTEDTATLGGMAATNASGALTYLYGPVRQHIVGLRVVLPDGRRLALRRGEQRAEGLALALEPAMPQPSQAAPLPGEVASADAGAAAMAPVEPGGASPGGAAAVAAGAAAMAPVEPGGASPRGAAAAAPLSQPQGGIYPVGAGEPIQLELPGYRMPAVKNAAGYFCAEGMDAVDLFIGSGGTLGAVSELEIALCPKPLEIWCATFFFRAGGSGGGDSSGETAGSPDDGALLEARGALAALRFVQGVRALPFGGGANAPGDFLGSAGSAGGSGDSSCVGSPGRSFVDGGPGGPFGGGGTGDAANTPGVPGARVAAIEYVGREAMRIRDAMRIAGGAAADAHIPAGATASVYVELHGAPGTAAPALRKVSALFESLGGDLRDTWFAWDMAGRARMTAFRHSIPESVNALVAERQRTAPGITKLATDFAVPPGRMAEALSFYLKEPAEAGVESAIWGHIGNDHLHVNLLPKTAGEYEKAKELAAGWATRVVAMGGSVSAEHGTGRLKSALLETQYGAEGVAAMQQVKRAIDPKNLFGAL
ncbi:MAG: FAD-binding protein [Clostridiales Family XIII bacterium]|jgi:FAD/FMN-containing dehydrogenase|nr:FAD-binding protein [Clostridiales Family XIII bacterium]